VPIWLGLQPLRRFHEPGASHQQKLNNSQFGVRLRIGSTICCAAPRADSLPGEGNFTLMTKATCDRLPEMGRVAIDKHAGTRWKQRAQPVVASSPDGAKVLAAYLADVARVRAASLSR
jgi:hypothetical protein